MKPLLAGLTGMILTVTQGQAQDMAPLPLNSVRTWAYQIQDLDARGAVDALAQSRYDLLVVEPTRTEKDSFFDTPRMVRRLQASRAGDGRHRKLVLAYICIGEAEDWRWYWTWSEKWRKNRPRPAAWPAFILRPDPDGWSGCFPVAYWDPAWKAILLTGSESPRSNSRPYRSVLDEVVRSGFDGVYLDWVEAYDDATVRRAAKKAQVHPEQEMVRLLGEIRKYGRQGNPNFMVVQQNAAGLLQRQRDMLAVIDAIAQEDIWHSGEADSEWDNVRGHDQATPARQTREYLRLLEPYQAAGKPVLTVDYTVDRAAETYRKSRAAGFVPYCTRVSLSRLTTTPPPVPTK